MKIHYADATLHVHLATGAAECERVTRRPIFYETNVLHRNTIDGWRWVILAGLAPPAIALVLHELAVPS